MEFTQEVQKATDHIYQKISLGRVQDESLGCIFKFTLIIKTYIRIGRGVLLPGAPDPVYLINKVN